MFLTFNAVLVVQVEVLIRIPFHHRVRCVDVHFDGGVILAVFSTLETGHFDTKFMIIYKNRKTDTQTVENNYLSFFQARWRR